MKEQLCIQVSNKTKYIGLGKRRLEKKNVHHTKWPCHSFTVFNITNSHVRCRPNLSDELEPATTMQHYSQMPAHKRREWPHSFILLQAQRPALQIYTILEHPGEEDNSSARFQENTAKTCRLIELWRVRLHRWLSCSGEATQALLPNGIPIKKLLQSWTLSWVETVPPAQQIEVHDSKINGICMSMLSH